MAKHDDGCECAECALAAKLTPFEAGLAEVVFAALRRHGFVVTIRKLDPPDGTAAVVRLHPPAELIPADLEAFRQSWAEAGAMDRRLVAAAEYGFQPMPAPTFQPFMQPVGEPVTLVIDGPYKLQDGVATFTRDIFPARPIPKVDVLAPDADPANDDAATCQCAMHAAARGGNL